MAKRRHAGQQEELIPCGHRIANTRVTGTPTPTGRSDLVAVVSGMHDPSLKEGSG
jgi:hypothetical protein